MVRGWEWAAAVIGKLTRQGIDLEACHGYFVCLFLYPRRVFVDNEISIKTLGFRRLDALLSLHQTTYTTNTTISFPFFPCLLFPYFLCPLPCLVLGFISASPYHEQTISL